MIPVSQKADTLIGSEIIRLNGEINQKAREGHKIFNLTIGDFDPALFPIPDFYKEAIIQAYRDNQTNYPPADGMASLRNAVAAYIKKRIGLDYPADQYLIAAGGRPLIYTIYQAIIDPNDKVVYPVPSWNNNHYCHLTDAQKIEIQTKPENGFLPTAEELAPHISEATLIALCSPLNPTGTLFQEKQLKDICDLIVAENRRRGNTRKPLYLLYDQIYWILTSGQHQHTNPVSLVPEMKEYTLFVDGISKALCATGVRVGWGMGPEHVISKMKSLLGHIGAWAPKAEQVALASFLSNEDEVTAFNTTLKEKINARFHAIYDGFMALKAKGYPVHIIEPQGAIYLSVQFALKGRSLPDGTVIQDTKDIGTFLLEEAHWAIVPFTAFGAHNDTDWFRVSIGTVKMEEIPSMFEYLEKALSRIQ